MNSIEKTKTIGYIPQNISSTIKRKNQSLTIRSIDPISFAKELEEIENEPLDCIDTFQQEEVGVKENQLSIDSNETQTFERDETVNTVALRPNILSHDKLENNWLNRHNCIDPIKFPKELNEAESEPFLDHVEQDTIDNNENKSTEAKATTDSSQIKTGLQTQIRESSNYLYKIPENDREHEHRKAALLPIKTNDSFDLDFQKLNLETPDKKVHSGIKQGIHSGVKPRYEKTGFKLNLKTSLTPRTHMLPDSELEKKTSSATHKQSFSNFKPILEGTSEQSLSTPKQVFPFKTEHSLSLKPARSRTDSNLVNSRMWSQSARKPHTFKTPLKKIIPSPRSVQKCNKKLERVLTGSQKENVEIRLPAFNSIMSKGDYLNEHVEEKSKFKKIAVNGNEYAVLKLLGRGGSSEVYLCHDITNNYNRAIKCVSLINPESAKSFISEVKALVMLQGCDRIIKMYDYEIRESERMLFVVLEMGGRDMSKILREFFTNKKHMSMHMLLFYWMEMLYSVKQIHNKGIIHSDLKPANFLTGEDSCLRLIDFGIASCVQTDMTSVIKTVAEGSYNYISPEALNYDNSSNTDSPTANKPKYKISYKSDVWSLGCILYQLVYHKTPFHNFTSANQKLIAILNPNHKIDYPEANWVPSRIIKTIKQCLRYDMKSRPSVDELISEYEHIFNNL